MWNKLSMANKAKYIAIGVQNGVTNLSDIIDTYNKYHYGGSKLNSTEKSQTVKPINRVNYYDPITGKNYGDTMPDNKVRVTDFRQLTPEAQDEYQQNRTVTLDNIDIYPTSGKGAKSTNIGSYYDAMNEMTEANRQHAQTVAGIDALIRETAAFEKPLNFLSPGQWFGAGIDYLQGEKPFWQGIYDGNSGWVSDEFAEENPRMTTLLNITGDGAFGYLTSPLTQRLKTPSFYRGVESPRLTSSIRRAARAYDVGQTLSLEEILTKDQLKTLDLLHKDTAPRLRNALSDEGFLMTNAEKDIVNNGVIDRPTYFVDVPVTDETLASAYGNSKVGIPINKIVKGFEEYPISMDEVIGHELEHIQRNALQEEAASGRLKSRGDLKQRAMEPIEQWMESKTYTQKEAEILDDAYTFTDNYLLEHDISPIKEKGATNRQLREQIIRGTKLTGDELDTYIDNMSDVDLIKRLKKVNGYSRDFFEQFLKENETSPGSRGVDAKKVKVKADKIRRALKYVAMNDSIYESKEYLA